MSKWTWDEDLLPFDIGADFGEAAVGVQDEAFSVWQGNVGFQRRTRTGPEKRSFRFGDPSHDESTTDSTIVTIYSIYNYI